MAQLHCWDEPWGQNVPAEQVEHDDDPSAAENVPASQSSHTSAPSPENFPCLQGSGTTVPFHGQYLPALQAVHVSLREAPTAGEKLPGVHFSRTLADALQLLVLQRV
jgi:hypothetical protein